MTLLCTDTENDVLDDLLAAARNPEVRLHTGDPGEDGTANRALQADDTTPVIAKAASFGATQARGGGGREKPSDAAVSWSGAEIPAGREITHVSVWSDNDTPTLTARWRLPLTESKTTGSDGIEFPAGDVTPGLD